MTVIIPFGVIMALAWQGLRDQSPKHAAAIILSNFQLKRLLKMLDFNLIFSSTVFLAIPRIMEQCSMLKFLYTCNDCSLKKSQNGWFKDNLFKLAESMYNFLSLPLLFQIPIQTRQAKTQVCFCFL